MDTVIVIEPKTTKMEEVMNNLTDAFQEATMLSLKSIKNMVTIRSNDLFA